MCRLLGWACTRPVTLEAVLGREGVDGFLALSELHFDGWGVARVGSDEPAAVRVERSTARALDERSRFELATGVASRAGLVHLRRASKGYEVCERNTHPFLAEGWAFGHNGGIPRPERLDALVGASRRGRRLGTTDSERYFLALLERIDEGGNLLEAIRATVADVRQACGPAGLNAVLLSAGALAVVQAAAGARPPLAELLEDAGGRPERIPPGHLDRYYQLCYRTVPGGVVVASTGVPDGSWTVLPDESVLVADLATARVSVSPLAGGAPLATFELASR